MLQSSPTHEVVVRVYLLVSIRAKTAYASSERRQAVAQQLLALTVSHTRPFLLAHLLEYITEKLFALLEQLAAAAELSQSHRKLLVDLCVAAVTRVLLGHIR